MQYESKVAQIDPEKAKRISKLSEINTAVIISSIVMCASLMVVIFTVVLSFVIFMQFDQSKEIEALREGQKFQQVTINNFKSQIKVLEYERATMQRGRVRSDVGGDSEDGSKAGSENPSKP